MSANRTVRWEYRSLRPARDSTKKEAEDPTDRLNELGEEGWELCESITYAGGGTKYLILKRPAATDTDLDGESTRE